MLSTLSAAGIEDVLAGSPLREAPTGKSVLTPCPMGNRHKRLVGDEEVSENRRKGLCENIPDPRRNISTFLAEW